MKLEPHVQRVVHEKADLQEKRKALDEFLVSKKICDVNAHHQNLLVKQAIAMREYNECLDLRLQDFGLRYGKDFK